MYLTKLSVDEAPYDEMDLGCFASLFTDRKYRLKLIIVGITGMHLSHFLTYQGGYRS